MVVKVRDGICFSPDSGDQHLVVSAMNPNMSAARSGNVCCPRSAVSSVERA